MRYADTVEYNFCFLILSETLSHATLQLLRTISKGETFTHTKSANLLGRVEHNGWEATGHFRVESDLDSRLDLVLALDQEIKKFLCVDNGFAEVSHQTDQGGVPLIHDL